MKLISKSRCADEDRMEFLPQHVGTAFLRYEQSVYHLMDQHCDGYSGGYWEFYDLTNGGFFMAFDAPERRFTVTQPSNYFEGEMSAEAASIGVNLYVQNSFSWQIDPDRFGKTYQALYNFAAQHPEGAQIMGFID